MVTNVFCFLKVMHVLQFEHLSTTPIMWQVLEATPSCPPALILLGDICTMGTVQERKKCLVQHLHILQELHNADPLRSPYWEAQTQHLVDGA